MMSRSDEDVIGIRRCLTRWISSRASKRKAFKVILLSFSDAIMRLRNMRGTASEDDEHDLTLPFHVPGNSHDASVSLDDPRL